MKLLKSLNDDLITLIYEYDGNEYNKFLYNKVIQELNLKRFNQFIKYNIFKDNKVICNCTSKTSRIYIMDMIAKEDFLKYTDYEIRLNEWDGYIETVKRWDKLEVAKNLMNYEDLYNYIMNRMRGCEDEFIEDFYFDFVINHNYFDKRIMKNEVYENYDIWEDTDYGFESDGSSEWSDTDESDYNESDEDDE